jgi:hypothetical protein
VVLLTCILRGLVLLSGMDRELPPYLQFMRLAREILDWTPEENRLSTLIDLYRAIHKPSVSTTSLLRLAIDQCQPPESRVDQ